MNKRIRIYSAFLFASLCLTARSGMIVYPWNATTAIVRAGESFEVWFSADEHQTVSTAELRGPYHAVQPSVQVTSGNWTYDQTSGNTYNTRIAVSVPVNAPADRYDLVLKTSSGNEVSTGAVKVIKEYRSAYSIFHISDTHMCQGAKTNGHPERLFKISALVDAANIIGPEIVFVTGDLINNNMFPPKQRSEFFYDGAMEYGLHGIHGFNAATFTTVGNHDYLETKGSVNGLYKEKAEFWNQHHGLQDHRFSYGSNRYMIVNDGWNGFDWKHQLAEHTAWLGDSGQGNLRIAAYHKSEMGIMGDWANEVDLGLALIGHNHHLAKDNPYELGGKPIQYYANSVREYINFNLFRIENDGSYSALNNLELVENPEDSPGEWRSRLSLVFARANEGSSRMNTVKIVNAFDVGFPRIRVRFVMPKGAAYTVSEGTVEQAFDGDDYHIVDVRVPVDANSTASISINPLTSVKKVEPGGMR